MAVQGALVGRLTIEGYIPDFEQSLPEIHDTRSMHNACTMHMHRVLSGIRSKPCSPLLDRRRLRSGRFERGDGAMETLGEGTGRPPGKGPAGSYQPLELLSREGFPRLGRCDSLGRGSEGSGMAIQIERTDHTASDLRRLGCRAVSSAQARRMLAIALVLEGADDDGGAERRHGPADAARLGAPLQCRGGSRASWTGLRPGRPPRLSAGRSLTSFSRSWRRARTWRSTGWYAGAASTSRA